MKKSHPLSGKIINLPQGKFTVLDYFKNLFPKVGFFCKNCSKGKTCINEACKDSKIYYPSIHYIFRSIRADSPIPENIRLKAAPFLIYGMLNGNPYIIHECEIKEQAA